ncbi:hypothetical protein SLEP1_g36877 [Rubroshorea leprosula]|uniref:Disease resistance protein At4g27190-like leucine-rich repeats domain-containing protein n=1 Tax=Rubroshorea leprosula TaxID=152421 RepID=A0AAV5KTD4_9ROSI|nr:hypothetical protein SLEP1_g36877 [Rubroshorea leprosula]
MVLMKLDLLTLQVDIPLLDDLRLSSICAQQIWHSQITLISSFVQNLRKLTMSNYNNLKYLFTSSMVKSFEQLEVLKIWYCKEMQVVILIEELVEKEKTSHTMFPKLDNLQLYDLPQLIRFCSNCNSLGEVYEAQGHNGSGSQIVAATQSNLVETEVTQFVFPQVTYLELSHLPNFKGFFPQMHITKWPLLKRMLVQQCDKVKTFASEFPSIEITYGDNQLERQTQDPMFWIRKAAFAAAAHEGDEVVPGGWNGLGGWRGSNESNGFGRANSQNGPKHALGPFLSPENPSVKNLKELVVEGCGTLKYLLTSSIVESFQQLTVLKISGCKMMEGVIVLEQLEEEKRMRRTLFPKLDSLVLQELPKFTRLCSGNFFEFPSLTKLTISKCSMLKTFISGFAIGNTTINTENEVNATPSLFCEKATFPSLERLVVKWNDNIKILCGHHPEGYFGKLKVLHLLGFPKQSALLPPFFFHSLPNLEKLLVKDAFFDEIFQCEEVTGEEKLLCGRTPLRTLRLSKLHELTHLWKEESQLEVDILRNLVTLKVQECSRLKNLVPSTVYFSNLQTLVVSECHGLVSLVRYSTAKSLGQLYEMKVANCEMIEEIVVCSGDAVKDGIVFTNLNCLQLKGLPRLESFCSGDCNFKFPDLEEVIVTECPNMQIFSKGELSTPELHEVKLTGDIYEYMDKDIDEDIEKKIDDIFNKDEGGVKVVRDGVERCWVGNLNSTVQQLFKEKVCDMISGLECKVMVI